MAIDNKDKKVLKSSIEREQNEVACSAECEKIKGSKNLNVPHLRFPEFSGEWEMVSLQDIATINPKSDPLQNTFIYIDLEAVEKGELRKIQEIMREEAPSRAQRVIDNNDILFQCVRPYQKNNYIHRILNTSNQQWVASTGYAQIRTTELPNYIYHLLNTDEFNRKVMVRCTGSSYPAINSEDLATIHLYYTPDKKEQLKISRLLDLLDKRIATQNKIIEDLKKLKSAIIEKVFCPPNQKQPVCRIKGFEQPLTTYKMNAFCSRIATKNMDAKCSLVLTIAAQYGLVNQGSFFNKSVASENLTGYYLLHKGEFAYNRSYSAGYDWGTVKRLDNCDEGVLSTLYICFKINETIVDSDFLTYYFESTKWHKGLSDIAGEGARNHGLLNVSMTDYFNTKHRFPSMEEQKVIAKMLNAITEREKKAIVLGECYRKQKQFLLCQMFI